MSSTQYTLHACKGSGSAIVEAMLTLADCRYHNKDYVFETLGPGCPHDDLIELNPLAQLPTLELPDGSVMTESAAITIYLSEQFPKAGLAPPVGNGDRAPFLRWLVFLGSALYATFTYGDFPERWVDGESAGKNLRRHTDAHRENLWKYLESNVVSSPWFLGDTFSALDIYVYVMTRWMPQPPWFAAHCPKLFAIAEAMDHDRRLLSIWQRNFPH